MLAPYGYSAICGCPGDRNLSCPWRGHSGAVRARGDQEQRLPGMPLRQDADHDQRRRQGGLPVCGCGQAGGLGPQDQYLRQLPRRHHRQAPGRQRPGPAARLRAGATRSNPRAMAPASTAWPRPRGRRAPPRAATATTATPSCRPTSPASPLHFSRLAETCGACHDQEAKDVEESVHGKAVAAGHRDAPTCTDCHSEHKITGAQEQFVACRSPPTFAATATPPSG